MSTNGQPDEAPGRLLRLLRLIQLCDSALPIGGYSHSWGLEAAIERRQVTGPAEVAAWVRNWLEHSTAPGDGVIVAHTAKAAAVPDWPAVANLNDLLTANKVSTTVRRASLKQGGALLELAAGLPWSGESAARLRACGPGPWHHATVFGVLAQAAGARARDALAVFFQNAAAAVVAAAVRAVPIGHTHAQQILARMHPHFAELADQWVDTPLDCFGGLSPAYEEYAYAQSQLYTRIFQS